MEEIKIDFKGLLRSPTSWARVNRELLAKLADIKNISLKLQPARGFLWDKNFPLPAKIKNLTGEHCSPDLQLMFAYPPALEQYRTDTDIPLWNLSVYEASRLPPDWVKPLNKYCERVIVPSTHVRAIYKRSGVKENKLEVVPYGVNAKIIEKYRKSREPDNNTGKLNVITAATPHRRKGLDLIKKCADLLSTTAINWHVHAPYQPEKEKSQFWEEPHILKELKSAGFKVTEEPVSDEKIIRMLSNADLCVQPSRSEGFGLVILEAMATQTPVLTSNWGGQLDFDGPGMIKVGGEMRRARDCQYDSRHPRARVFEPNIQELKSKLQSLADNPAKLQKLGNQARRTVKNLTWKKSAHQLAELINTNLN
ncbi:MAG: glycosyltransferase family 4 protein [bacterium]